MSEASPELAASAGKGGGGPVIPVILIGAGAYLAWFAVKYWRSQSVAWPSDPVKAILQGKQPPSNTPATTATAQLTAYETTLAQQSASQGGSGGGGITGSEPTGSAQNIAKLLLSKYGWGSNEMGDLISLWTRESGWSATARNPTSGAYGIAQALGHGTSCSAAPSGENNYGPEYGLSCQQAQQANGGSALWQIRWGLGYIKSRYGSPAGAWAHEQSAGWY